MGPGRLQQELIHNLPQHLSGGRPSLELVGQALMIYSQAIKEGSDAIVVCG